MADDRQHHRARPPARGRGTHRQRGADAQGPGRSSGGLSTKIHAATDALSAVRLLLGPGHRQDITRAHALIDSLEPGAVIADKGYDPAASREAIRKAGAEPVILPRQHP